ncbi:hypothetical protein J4E85_006478 [Alternaria conjuncta]|uniref:uncharacterized protein n=1 Tax=Alternaria conjuncta TaxID=181017 RepID=UPI0022212122|nr:uncharacterized protein J4E85_006478 [Alternaria conjuncta]KAI4926186.1 hypothetical protein J4E85_006478 [Alternaria conjuncta]
MKFLNAALLLALSICNVANTAAVPIASPDVARSISDAAARQDPPAHGMCYLYLNIVEKKPQNPQDIDTTVWVALSDGQNKTIEGMTWDDGEPLKGMLNGKSIDGKPPGQALKIHGLFKPTDTFSLRWINMTPGAHWEWFKFQYTGGMVGTIEFDDSFKGWKDASCNRTEWVNQDRDYWDRLSTCYFEC